MTCTCTPDKRCKACINERALSLKEVQGEYRGWTIRQIIEKRSHRHDNGTGNCAAALVAVVLLVLASMRNS